MCALAQGGPSPVSPSLSQEELKGNGTCKVRDLNPGETGVGQINYWVRGPGFGMRGVVSSACGGLGGLCSIPADLSGICVRIYEKNLAL